jgi:Flp pilus assembly protein TadG
MRDLMVRVHERGAAAVEFALVLPVLVMILLGVVDFGMVVNAQAIVADAARQGARAVSLGGDSAAGVTAAAKSSQSLLGFSTTSSPTVPVIAVTCYAEGTTSFVAANAESSCSVAETGDIVVVTVTYVYKWISPAVFGLPGTSSVVKQAYMRIEA